MGIKLSIPSTKELKPRIVVFGVGGAGGNAVNNMIGSALAGVEFVIANTDAQALSISLAERKIQLGVGETAGLGAGSRPEVGRSAAEEELDQIADQLQGCHMVFVTAGMGGGTGTGAAPVIARVARDLGILTVGVVTKPFQFEGQQRMRVAEAGIEELQRYVDTLIIIPNQNLFRVANEKTTFAEAFKMADNVLYSGVRGVTDLMVMPGLINLDFADVKAVMGQMGKAMMGTGESEGEGRALDAAEKAIANPLLDDVSMKGARGVLINITGGPDLTLFEVDEAANRIRKEVDADANIIVGSALSEDSAGKIRISVVATGIDCEVAQQEVRPAATVTPLVRPTAHRGQPGYAQPGFGQSGYSPGYTHTAAPRSHSSNAHHSTVNPMASGAVQVRQDARTVPQSGTQSTPQASLRTQVQAKFHPEEDLVPRAPAESQRTQRTTAAQSRMQAHSHQTPTAHNKAPAPQQGELPVMAPSGADAAARAEARVAPSETYVPPRPQTVERSREFIRPAASETRVRPTFLQRIAGMARGSLSVDVTPQASYQPSYQPEPLAPVRRPAPRIDPKSDPKPEQTTGPASEHGSVETDGQTQPVVQQAVEPAFQQAVEPTVQPPVQSGGQSEAQYSPVQGSHESQSRPATQIEDDLLDIPAFLRRQAN
jgi:cell division protein FtsZ